MQFSLFILIILSICYGISKYEESKYSDKDQFPKALIFNNKPIDPNCILSTQFGDSSRFFPKPLHSTIKENAEDSYVTIIDHTIDYSKIDKNIVRCTRDYQYHVDDNPSLYHSEITYQAWKITDETSLVLVNHYDTSGTGRFTNLGLVKREGNHLINAGEIASGDRAHGTVCVDSFKDGIIQYRTAATSMTILKLVSPDAICLSDLIVDSPLDYAGELIWQHYIQDGKTTKSILIGINFYEGNESPELKGDFRG